VQLLLDTTVDLDKLEHLGAFSRVISFLTVPDPTLIRTILNPIDEPLNRELNKGTNCIDYHSHDKLIAHIAVPVIRIIIIAAIEDLSKDGDRLTLLRIG